jgi:hypothetical protein
VIAFRVQEAGATLFLSPEASSVKLTRAKIPFTLDTVIREVPVWPEAGRRGPMLGSETTVKSTTVTAMGGVDLDAKPVAEPVTVTL